MFANWSVANIDLNFITIGISNQFTVDISVFLCQI
jgi:hypothetical protein